MTNHAKTTLRADVWVPAIGAAVGVGLSILGLAILLSNASAFWKGVGFALIVGGSLSGFNCYGVARTNSALPPLKAVARNTRGIREWWNTPKLYPSGDRFAPKESFLYGGICLVGAIFCFAGTGLAFGVLANLRQF